MISHETNIVRDKKKTQTFRFLGDSTVQVRCKLDTSGKIEPTKLIIRLGTRYLYVRLSGLGGRDIRSIHDKGGGGGLTYFLG